MDEIESNAMTTEELSDVLGVNIDIMDDGALFELCSIVLQKVNERIESKIAQKEAENEWSGNTNGTR